MSRQNRLQPLINRNSDEGISEDHWLKEFEKKLLKDAVQPRNTVSLYDQISSVMNGTKAKYPSVQAAVDDMMQRSGLSNYLKVSEDSEQGNTKVAQSQPTPPAQPKQTSDQADVIVENPAILRTIENYVKSTRGNLPVPAILDKIRSIHRGDISEDKMWEDDKLIRLISKLNLDAKKNNPASYENYSNLATGDRDTAESDVDPSNTDAFNALMPAKM
jgi:hypothetical protein